MSEKFQEFIEGPQEFIREGNQVCHSASPLTPLAHDFHSFSFDAQNRLEKVFALCLLPYRSTH